MSNECMSLPPLKPCPFCGAIPILVYDEDYEEWQVSCICSSCEVLPNTFFFDTEAKATSAWNRRAGESNE